ncbi:protein OSB1, mitochondrial-like [Asparagus officinalis]|uniref:protein OSB1, mitochondrial-like n=1 Tax=Asparagus officinalis TaxID=4686 RepID=UPI00098E129C|nr:protein OSB1, mitochondrial-like [Asparagus officinalis]
MDPDDVKLTIQSKSISHSLSRRLERVNLTFWDELAHVAFQHVEKGQQIYVSGRLVSDTVQGDDEKTQVYYKVVVQKLNFIEKTYPAVSLYNPESNSVSSEGKFQNYGGNSSGSTEKLWQAFFANPVDWWDNRQNKATHISVGVDVCMSYERRLYFSLPRVQHVLHANRTKLPYRMSMCSHRVFLFLEFI